MIDVSKLEAVISLGPGDWRIMQLAEKFLILFI